jgi:FtsH-binding integral membrane protein
MLDFGQASDESYAAGQTVAQCSQMVRKGFIRKVYGILSVQLLATAMMCALAMKATASEKVRSGMGVSVCLCVCMRL